jgi:hypothetical protein
MSYHSTTDTAEKDFQEERDRPMKKLATILKDNRLVRFFARYAEDQYRPEKHYMRGPGPKASAKAHGGAMPNGAFAKNAPRTPRS